MDTTFNVTNAWQRMRRQSLLAPRLPAAEEPDAPVDDSATEGGETLPMLYRSEAFAEDLFDSHPLLVCAR